MKQPLNQDTAYDIQPSIVSRVLTESVEPEKALLMQQAAAELVPDGPLVTIIDPTDRDQTDEFIGFVQDSDRYLIAHGYNGIDAVRTADQIDRNMIQSAVRRGRALVAITKPETGEGLQVFRNQLKR